MAPSIKYWPGDVFVNCAPFSHVLHSSWKGQRCDHCFTMRSGLKKCAGCGQFYYCDKKCQKLDWIEGHKYGECEVYKKASVTVPHDEFIHALNRINHVLRLYLKVTKSPEMASKQHQLFNGKSRCFNDLIHHLEEKKKFVINFEDQKQELFGYFQAFGVEFDGDLLLDIKEKMNTNSFATGSSDSDGYWVRMGSGLYIETSIFDHSCEPNALHSFDGHKTTLTATHEIRNGEEIMIMYRNAIELPVDQRQKMFKQEYYFECCCRMCQMNPNQELEFKSSLWELIKKRIEFKQNLKPTLVDAHQQALNELELCRLRERTSFKVLFWVCFTRLKLVFDQNKSLKQDVEFQRHLEQLKKMLDSNEETSKLSNKQIEEWMHSKLEQLGKKAWQLFSPDYVLCY